MTRFFSVSEPIERDEFRTPCSPEGLRVFQLTTDNTRSSYMENLNAIRWTADSKRFVFYREASDDRTKPDEIWVCDIENGFQLRPCNTIVPAVSDGGIRPVCPLLPSSGWYYLKAGNGETHSWCFSPDGIGLYQVIHVSDRFELRRVSMETAQSESLFDFPAPIKNWGITVSADGRRVGVNCFLGDGKTKGAPWAMRMFDIGSAQNWIVEMGNQCVRGATYCHGAGYADVTVCPGIYDLVGFVGPEHYPDADDWLTPPDGAWRNEHMNPAGDGSNGWGHWYVFRDDGSDFPRPGRENCRVIPFWRRPDFVGSHHAWRGNRAESFVITGYHHGPDFWRAPFLEAGPTPISEAERQADVNPVGSICTDLSRFSSRADACHFNFDASGRHVVTDTDGYSGPATTLLYVGTVIEPRWNEAPFLKTQLIGIPRTSWKGQPAHPHPVLSPDGKYILFQSDFTGRPQLYLATGYDFP